MGKVLINVGCGFTAGESWLNFDASPTLLYEKVPLLTYVYRKNEVPFPENVEYGDITKKRLCAPDTADGVFASHVFEHMAHDAMQTALRNIFDMLKPGGIFRLIVPDLEKMARKYIEDVDKKRPEASLEFITATGMGIKNSAKTLFQKLVGIFGHSQHLWMYDTIAMESELRRTGFVNIRMCSFNDGKIEEFKEVEEEERFKSEFGDEVCLQCEKPQAPSSGPTAGTK